MADAATRQRQRRYRQRQRDLVMVVPTEVSLNVVLFLESEGFLAAQFEQDREAVARALARFAEQAARKR
ncbi:MAG: hypothetical protein GEV13_10665 [Rhodospirillales bacterium]|nr:hypothetical protein [Rhodospirillales bacterium]